MLGYTITTTSVPTRIYRNMGRRPAETFEIGKKVRKEIKKGAA